jgi:hypothetical protein
MISWRKKVEEYVELRRSFGFKLLDANNGLIQFASFLEQSRATHITIALAMKWAQQDKNARPTEWARRLSFVRGFARNWSAHDSRTEVPPPGLLPYRPGRARPYLYSNEEIRKLLQAARRLPSDHGLRGPTYYSLLGLLAVAGLRISEAPFGEPSSVNAVSYPSILRRVRCSPTMHPGGIVFWGDSQQPSSYPAAERGWTAPRSGARFTPCHGRLVCVGRRIVMDRVFTIFVTGLPWKLWSSGIGPVKM